MEVYIGSRGAVVFPGGVCVDGHENGCIHRFVTHIHADHVIDLDRSVVYSKQIIATPITIELLKVMGRQIPTAKVLPIEYGKTVELNEKTVLRVAMADHIPGSAQVVLEVDGVSMGYTGDFRNPGSRTEILENLDILVIDATYGDPSYVREPEEVIVNEFVKLTRKLLSEGPVAVYAYHGKINDIMIKLRSHGIDAPYIIPLSQWGVYTVLAKYGYSVSDVFVDGSREAEEVKRSRWYIEFNLYTRFSSMKMRNGISHVLVTGRYGKTIAKLGRAWVVGLSGHADFKELVYYVDVARPRLLIVDGYRSSYAHAFSSYVNSALKIRSVVMPF